MTSINLTFGYVSAIMRIMYIAAQYECPGPDVPIDFLNISSAQRQNGLTTSHTNIQLDLFVSKLTIW